MKKNYFNYLKKICLSTVLVISAGFATAQTTLYDNGPIFNSTGTGAGGANESVQYSTTLGMATTGYGANQVANWRIGDDFTINDCQWKIDSIVFFCYQTSSGNTSTITSVNFRISDSIPDVPGSTLVYGDTTTNKLTRTAWSGVYRVAETAPGITTRPIMRNVCAVSDLTLTKGNYWVDWSFAGTGASGPWSPPIVLLNTAVTGNGKQRANGTWADLVDAGTDAAQGFPFIIYGSSVPNDSITQTFVECAGFSVTVGTNTYDTTGVYIDVFTNAAGCDSVVTSNLTINSVSNITTTVTGATITANNTGATYQWLDCNNNNAEIGNQTGQSFTATAIGKYAVELTQNGCVDTSACITISSLSIVENSFGDNFAVYPNPTNGNFFIDLGATYENAQITITDISGRLIVSKNTTTSQVLNLSIEEPAGIYFVSVQTGNDRAFIRLIKQ